MVEGCGRVRHWSKPSCDRGAQIQRYEVGAVRPRGLVPALRPPLCNCHFPQHQAPALHIDKAAHPAQPVTTQRLFPRGVFGFWAVHGVCWRSSGGGFQQVGDALVACEEVLHQGSFKKHLLLQFRLRTIQYLRKYIELRLNSQLLLIVGRIQT